ncbi:kinase-like domain-containing protein [Trametes punicea]|nr:kinase-like domain-containing protein [Trametes punicea]
MSPDNPPWLETDANGHISVLEVPARLSAHPEVLRRGLEPVDTLKIGVVYRTSQRQSPQYVIKILHLDSEEREIYQRLLENLASPNHTIPAELTSPDAGHPLLIMPALWDYVFICHSNSSLYDTLGSFLQLIEGVEYLHDHHIAHMDLCPDNIVTANRRQDQPHPHVIPGKLYIIDFGSSRQFHLGPGEQPAITLPPSQIPPPNGLKRFDPYSWDVYCAAQIMQVFLEMNHGERCPPWIARRYIEWLIGTERGCTDVCRCRPTARKARQVLAGIRWVVGMWEMLEGVLRYMSSTLRHVFLLRIPYHDKLGFNQQLPS